MQCHRGRIKRKNGCCVWSLYVPSMPKSCVPIKLKYTRFLAFCDNIFSFSFSSLSL